jgi:L-cysteate sulfo-lyase
MTVDVNLAAGQMAGTGQHVPRVALGLLPTPLHGMPRLAGTLANGPELLVKREDLSGLGLGGNKARKLQALLADARQRRATVALITGGVQSNCCAQSALAARMMGLRAELLLRGEDPGSRTGNLLIASLVDAEMWFLGSATDEAVAEALRSRVEELQAAGERPYVIPLGGSTPLGAAACASMVDELATELHGDPPTHIVLAAGSLGTMVGLILGTWAHGLECQVHGYTVLWDEPEVTGRLEELLAATRERFFPDLTPQRNYRLFAGQLGGGYGVPTAEGERALRLVAVAEGLLLDNTYTAKAMAGLLQGAGSGLYGPEDRVVFVHTGGAGGLMAVH